MSDSNCAAIEPRTPLQLASHAHGPVGQAFHSRIHAQHCAIRRGVRPDDDVGVLVLAAKRDNASHTKLCCVEASLTFPKVYHGDFLYDTVCYFSFQDPDYAEKGAALYLRAMRKGVKLAKDVAEKCGGAVRPMPLSLCSSSIRIGNYIVPNAELLKTPIPDAYPADDHEHQRWNISQGELFTVVFDQTQWRAISDERGVVLVNSTPDLNKPLQLKVSCAAMHRHVVSQGNSMVALEALRLMDNPDLRESLAKVLLAATQSFSPTTFISVMNNISSSHGPLRPSTISRQMSGLWKAIEKLMTSVLLPMAMLGVVHADIRPGWTVTANILCSCLDGKIELVLIDLESLIVWSNVSTIQNEKAAQASFMSGRMTPVKYVWLQVAWIAYVWALRGTFPLRANGTPKDNFSDFAIDLTLGTLSFPGLNDTELEELANEMNNTDQTLPEDVTKLLNMLSPLFP